MLFTIVLAMILSIDCLGVGLSYGMRTVSLPWYGRVIISACSGVAIAVSMCLGKLLEGAIPGEQIHLFGECMLVCLGFIFLMRGIMELRKKNTLPDNAEHPLFQCKIPGMDIIVKIMQDPQQADLDQSGQINSKEAVWLGFALAMDSFGAGICIALMGFSVVWLSVCTLFFAYSLVTVGYIWGQRAGANPAYEKLQLLPGILLITLGLTRILFF